MSLEPPWGVRLTSRTEVARRCAGLLQPPAGRDLVAELVDERRARPSGRLERPRHRIGASALEVVGVGLDDAVEIAALRPHTRPRGLSLGDRACLALAALRRCAAVTADTGWTELDLEIDVDVIR